MAYLGELAETTDVEFTDEVDTFSWHGVEFELPSRMSFLPMLKLMWEMRRLSGLIKSAQDTMRKSEPGSRRYVAAAETEAQADQEQAAVLYDFLRSTLPGPQWDRFEQTAHAHGSAMDELLRLAFTIYEVVANRPQSRPTDSSVGPSTSASGSTDASASPGPGPSLPAPVETDRERQVREYADLMVSPLDLVGRR